MATAAERKAEQEAAAEATQKAALAAFAARRKAPAKAGHPFAGNVGDLSVKSAQIKAARAVVVAVVRVFDGAKLISETPLDDAAAVGAAVVAELTRHKDTAFTQNMLGKARYAAKLRIEIDAAVK